MERLIKYDALIEAFNHADSDIIVDYEDGKCDFGFSLERIQKVINSVPDADVSTVRHGRWENITGGMITLGDCSECKARQPVIGTNYCKNCGAMMEGGSDG